MYLVPSCIAAVQHFIYGKRRPVYQRYSQWSAAGFRRIGIGLGSLAAGYLSGNQIEYGLIPLARWDDGVWAGFGVAWAVVPALAVLLACPDFCRVLCGAIAAMIQHRPDESKKGKINGIANMLSFVGVFAALSIFLHAAAGALATTHNLLRLRWLLATSAYLLGLPDAFLRTPFWLHAHALPDQS
jgi:acyl-[acyl-carrier-protein]-phospholipid O-acyltransferase/long-chain-fatty-acid--[acyl-carrier-protein] ligase